MSEAAAEGDPQVAIAILDRDGKPLSGNVAAVDSPSALSLGGARSAVLRMKDETSSLEATVSLSPLAGGNWLLTGRTVSAGISLRETLERSLLVALAVSVILGLLCGLIIGQYVDRRVHDIVRVADRISGGDMSGRVPLSGANDSFEELSRQINHMLDRISTLMGELRMLTDSLAHDLRSPVGRLRAAADAALAADTPEERDQMLGAIIRQSDSLMRILTTALEIARSEAFTSQNQFSWFDPVQLCDELVEMYEPVAEEAGASIRLDRGPIVVPVFGHRQLLAQALSNLIENAIKYGASGGEIAVLVHDEDFDLEAWRDRPGSRDPGRTPRRGAAALWPPRSEPDRRGRWPWPVAGSGHCAPSQGRACTVRQCARTCRLGADSGSNRSQGSAGTAAARASPLAAATSSDPHPVPAHRQSSGRAIPKPDSAAGKRRACRACEPPYRSRRAGAAHPRSLN